MTKKKINIILIIIILKWKIVLKKLTLPYETLTSVFYKNNIILLKR